MASSTICLPGIVQFHPQHQPETAHLFDEGVLARQLVELNVEISAHALNRGQQLVENVQNSSATRQASAPPPKWCRASPA